jgi:hypothetical protein
MRLKMFGGKLDLYHWGEEIEDEGLPIFDVRAYKHVRPRMNGMKLAGTAQKGWTFWIVLFRHKLSVSFEREIPWTKEDMRNYWREREKKIDRNSVN